MATDAQIGAAARGDSKPTGAGFLADDHLLAGATLGLPDDEAGAAEMFARIIANRHRCGAPRRLREAQRTGNQALIADVARNPAAYCTHPAHDEDVEWLGEVLQWLGLRPTPAPVRRRDAVTARPKHRERRGRCRECGKRQAIRADGTVRGHGGCPGESQPPQEEDQ